MNLISMQLIKEYGINNNRIVRAKLSIEIPLIPLQMAAADLITNDLLLLDKHKKINKEIEDYINNLY